MMPPKEEHPMRSTPIRLVVLALALAGCNRGGAGDTAPSGDLGADSGGAPPAARVEPVAVELPGWREEVQSEGEHLRKVWHAAEGSCALELDRWWGLPPDPGGPMQVASSRPVTVDGREVELITTAMFEGTEQQVQAAFFPGADSTARLVLRDCPEDAVAAALAGVRLAAP
jgi:hypothetical protein